jgi:hypothetical protein
MQTTKFPTNKNVSLKKNFHFVKSTLHMAIEVTYCVVNQHNSNAKEDFFGVGKVAHFIDHR